jgi:predicted  nucleic acid-binding Zn-ribbon protein
MSVTADVLRELHRIQRQLADVRERTARGPKQVQAHQLNVNRLIDESRLQADAKAAKLSLDQKQLLLRAGEGKIDELNRKLNAATSNREYQALRDQIAADKMANSVLEDEILDVLSKLDDFKVAVAQEDQNVGKAKDELAKLQESVRSRGEQLLAELHRLEADLKQVEGRLPQDLKQVYDRIVKSKGADAMAAVEGESCGGCFQHVTPNVMNQLYMSVAVQCHSCGRLLYLPEGRTR